MYGLKQKLLEEEKCLKEILSGIGEPKADALEGTLRISMDKNKVRYFHHFPNENNKKKDIYISKAGAAKSADRVCYVFAK